MGFSIVPHTWLPEKLAANCRACPLFRQCGQFALITSVEGTPESVASDHSLHV
jgi:N-acetylglutamate synthase-like GNAT family acetyltransferase